jgi:hypothetical protein
MKRKVSLLLAVLFVGSYLLAQATPQALLAARPPKVEQGKQVIITVKIAPPSNIAGNVFVSIAPDSQPSQQFSLHNGVGAGATSTEMGTIIPPDGKLGLWKVVNVRFEPPNSTAKDLTITGDTSFEVIERKTVLPTTAEVQVK